MGTDISAQAIIRELGLEPHPEGGFTTRLSVTRPVAIAVIRRPFIISWKKAIARTGIG